MCHIRSNLALTVLHVPYALVWQTIGLWFLGRYAPFDTQVMGHDVILIGGATANWLGYP